MRRALLAVALLLTACAGPRNALNTPESTCFRGLPEAAAAVGGKGKLVGVRRIERGPLVAKVPEAARLQARSLCLVAYRGPFVTGDVPGADPPGPGAYALVALDDRSFHPLATFVLDRLPVRFRHNV